MTVIFLKKFFLNIVGSNFIDTMIENDEIKFIFLMTVIFLKKFFLNIVGSNFIDTMIENDEIKFIFFVG